MPSICLFLVGKFTVRRRGMARQMPALVQQILPYTRPKQGEDVSVLVVNMWLPAMSMRSLKMFCKMRARRCSHSVQGLEALLLIGTVQQLVPQLDKHSTLKLTLHDPHQQFHQEPSLLPS